MDLPSCFRSICILFPAKEAKEVAGPAAESDPECSSTTLEDHVGVRPVLKSSLTWKWDVYNQDGRWKWILSNIHMFLDHSCFRFSLKFIVSTEEV